jgi:hypothetical protein
VIERGVEGLERDVIYTSKLKLPVEREGGVAGQLRLGTENRNRKVTVPVTLSEPCLVDSGLNQNPEPVLVPLPVGLTLCPLPAVLRTSLIAVSFSS